MSNIIRIRRLEEELNLNNVIIPVDKESYGPECKQINILDLKNWILSNYNGLETYTSKYPLSPFWAAGGILADDSRFPTGFNNVTIIQMFDLILYPPVTTTTTTL